MKELLTLTKVMMAEKKAVFLAILLGFIAAISSVGLIGSGGYLISQSALQPPLYTLTLTIIAVRFFGLARAASRYAERYFSHKATFSILGKLRVYFYDKIEPLAPALFSTYRSGDLLSRVVADVDRLQYFFLRVFYPPFVMVVVFIATGVLIYTFSIGLSIILFLGLVVVGFVIPLIFTLFTQNHGLKLREKRSQLSVETTEYLYGFTDLRTNRRLKAKQKEIETISEKLIEEQEKDGLLAAKGESISLTLAFLTAWFTLLFGVIYVENGTLSGVYLAMLVLITLTVFEAATPMAIIPGHLDESKVASERLFQLTGDKGATQEPSRKTSEETSQQTSQETSQETSHEIGKEVGTTITEPFKINFTNVSFSYPNTARKAINNITFEVAAKKKIAIVGASGSGKSSLVNLLLKFYGNYEGDISLAGKRLAEISEDEARNLFAVVAQENHFFSSTIRENLLLAKPEATDDELALVLADVSLSHLSLDNQLIEKGLSLSGGERQRLAIARMLLKDAPVLLLDEPTTGLDSITEQEVLSVLWPKIEHKSVIYITHRLVGLEKMDEIIVFEKGEIGEQGSYQQLIEQQGHFYELTKLEKERIS
ncbi:MAG: thiol reductant ABC exporter subunit CydC [Anaerobacillus sp.]|uniref:thiol reductant ABC exporter subunit CydC n=1 Tax=Anaerobacillus sp. TaxID=1872506 RepID=UPI0039199C4C